MRAWVSRASLLAVDDLIHDLLIGFSMRLPLLRETCKILLSMIAT
jgi:hypothetical protein